MSTPPDYIDRLLEQAAGHYYSAPAEALRGADDALARLGDDAPPARRARALMTRGCALACLGRHADSLATLQQALEIAPPGAGRLRTQLLRAHAMAYDELGALDASLHWGVQAVDAARAEDDPALLADAVLTVAVARSRSGDREAGLQHNREVLAIYESINDEHGCLQALNNIGIDCKNLGRHDEAVQFLQRALALALQRQDGGGAAVVACNLGEPLWRLGRVAEARAAMLDAIERTSNSGYPSAEVHARTVLGELLHAEGESVAAQAELERALAIAIRGGSRNPAARCHKALAALHKAAGRFEQALQHHEAFHAADKAQFNEDSDRKLRALQVQFDLARARHDAQTARLEAAALAEQTRTDALTGLANRRHLDEHLAAEFARAHRLGHALALAMADVDDFKQINDRFGHGTGDAVLRAVAALLRQHCRAIDVVARYGGEEFCIVFLEADGAHAARACEAMRAAVASHDWAALQPGLAVTLSIGLADPAGLDGPQALLAAADARLYVAKRGGKNRVVSA